MKRGKRIFCGLTASFFLFAGGCAVSPSTTQANLKAPVAQRDLLADAASAVERTPWPKPQRVSLISRVTGAGADDLVSRRDAVDVYVAKLDQSASGFHRLEADASANLAAAKQLNQFALAAVHAPRLSMNDVAIVENTIMSLREQRHIYSDAAKVLKKSGVAIDDNALKRIRDDYHAIVKELGRTADLLADRIDEDHSETYASPRQKNFSDL